MIFTAKYLRFLSKFWLDSCYSTTKSPLDGDKEKCSVQKKKIYRRRCCSLIAFISPGAVGEILGSMSCPSPSTIQPIEVRILSQSF